MNKAVTLAAGALLSLLTLFGCASAKKHFENGNYDKAIDISTKRLRKDPRDQKHIAVLVNSFRLANERDLAEIDRLKASSGDDHWERTYKLYRQLEHRQQLVKQLPALRSDDPMISTDFTFTDYAMEMAKSKEKAVENFYENGIALLEKNDRFSARLAYDYFARAYSYDQGYRDVSERMRAARTAGYSHILFGLAHSGLGPSYPDLERYVMQYDLSSLNRDWLMFHTLDDNGSYHYFAEARIYDVLISPERIRESFITEKAIVENGWEYEKDKNGAIRKDTVTGKPIKRILYKEVSVSVKIVEQYRECTIRGMVTAQREGGAMLFNENISGYSTFTHQYAMASGDDRALSVKSRQLLGYRPARFPSDQEMIMQAAPQFKTAVYDKLRQNRNIFE